MENKMLQYKVKQISRIGKTLLVMALMAWSSLGFAQTLITFDISKGNVVLTDATYSGTNSDGVAISDAHDPSNIYEISGTTDAYTIKVGTSSTAVTKNFIIRLAGVDIDAPHTTANHAAAFYVNAGTGSTVFVILKNSTSNSLKSYGYTQQFAHAGIEKETDTDGKLVVTCQSGYTNYLANNDTGHTCGDSDNCGSLMVTAYGDTYRLLSGGNWGNLQASCGAGIGSAGSTNGTIHGGGTSLNNLIIAGGKITAKAEWNHLCGLSYRPGEDAASFAPGIGVGGAYGGSFVSSSGYIKITGGKINAIAGNGAAACIGGGYRSKNIRVDIHGGHITANTRTQNRELNPSDPNYYADATYRGPGIGVGGGGEQTGSQGQATVNIWGGNITATSEYGAAIGGAAGGSNDGGLAATVNIYGGTIDARTTSTPTNGGAGAAIGTGGSTGRGAGGYATVNISGSTTNITAYSQFGADIGGAGTNSSNSTAVGGQGDVTITGGTITTTGGGIGGGKANAGTGGAAVINITGGTINSTSIGGGYSVSNNAGSATVTVGGTADITLSGGIGGGNSTSTSDSGNGGQATVTVNAGTLTAGGVIGGGSAAGTGNGGQATVNVNGGSLRATSIGGGNATKSGGSGNGGAATVTVSGGTLVASDGHPTTPTYGTIGGGDANGTGNGGNAIINVSGGTLTCAGIGGGDAKGHKASTPTSHKGGDAEIIVSGGTLTCESIGGGDVTSGTGGNASIDVTGGTLDCASIGGGDAGLSNGSYGLPGSVIHATNPAGIYIHGDSPITVKSGFIGGGHNEENDAFGFATASLTAPNANIQGQFVLVNTEDGRHCSFNMTGGTINNVNLGTGKYLRTRNEGGAVYMTDTHGATVDISGGTIKRSSGTLGGAVYMLAGTCTISGTALIDSCYTTSGTDIGLGGGVYLGGGSFNMSGGTMQRCMAPDKGGAVYLASGTVNMSGGTIGGSAANTNMNTAVNAGGGIYMAGGSFTMTGGNLQYNKVTAIDGEDVGTADGGGVYIASGGTADFHGGNIKGNEATHYGGGFYINPGSAITTLINSSSANMSINGNKAVNGGGAYIASGTVTLSEPSNKLSIYDNQARNGNGGGIYLYDGTFNLNGGQVGGYTSGETKYPGNKATFDTEGGLGGGIYLASGTFNLNGGTLGGVSVAEGPNTTMNQAYLSGGGLYMAGGTFEMNHGNLQYNNASGSGDSQGGGGVFLNTGGVAHIYGGHIIGNQAVSKGGGLYVNPTNSTDETPITSTQDAIEISGNIAAYGAGAYIANGIVNVEQSGSNAISIHSNAASTNGGGFYLATGTFNLKSGVLGGSSDSNRNTAAYHGGGLYIAGGAFTMTGGSLQYNKATTANTSNGGGVYIASGLATINGGNISNNQAANYGGGFFVNPSSAEQTTIINSNSNNTVISGNTALLGGGAYINNGILAVAGSSGSYTTTVKSNSATGTGDGKGRGGAFYVAAGSANIAHAFIGAEGEANTATVDGGGIYAIGPVTLGDGAMVQSNTATQNGGGVYVNNATFTMNSGSTLGGNAAAKGNSAANGGGVYVTGSSASVSLVSGSAVQYNTASTSGGGVYANQGTVGITSATIDHNSAVTSGGGVYAKGSVSVTTSEITNNEATATGEGDGGGVYVATGGHFSLDGGTVSTNSATRNGGGFYVDPDGSKTTTNIVNTSGDVLISGNEAVLGGGAYLATGSLNINGSTGAPTYTININDNAASTSGGAAYVEGGSVDIMDATIGEIGKPNTAVSGGGIYAKGNVTLETGAVLQCNTATQGGAVYLYNGAFQMETGSVLGGTSAANGNVASQYGGAVYLGGSTGGTFTMNDGDIQYNQAYSSSSDDCDGGAIYIAKGTADIHGGTIHDNSAERKGGGIYLADGTFNIDGGSIGTDGHPNTSTKTGGGVYVDDGAFNMSGGSLSYNVGTTGGGGAYVNGGAVTITGGSLSNNRTNNASGYGGGIFANGGNVIVKSATVDGNIANSLGGGIYAAGATTTVTIDKNTGEGALNAVFSNNNANKGGGIYAQALSVTVANASFTGNSANNSGGGIYTKKPGEGTCTVTLNSGTTFTSNLARGTGSDEGGGAVYVDDGIFIMNSGVIGGSSDNANQATNKNGGGFYVTGSNASVTVNGGEISYNTASNGYGGGFYVKGVSTTAVNVNNTTQINYNSAKRGAGIFMDNGMVTIIGTSTGVTMNNNVASERGGGLYMQNGNVTASTVNVQNNRAESEDGGGFYVGGSDVTVSLTSATISNNTTARNGGGLYVTNGTISVTGGSFSSNTATSNGGALYSGGGSVTFTDATMSGNAATNFHGGAIYASANVTIKGGTLSANRASSGNGGFLYASTGSDVTIQASPSSKDIPVFKNNNAVNGGVVYMETGTCNLESCTMGGSHTDRNTATYSGGAIYSGGGILKFTDGTVSYNTAGESGGAFHVAEFGTLELESNVTLSKNHVPAGKMGGGVFLAGIVRIGGTLASQKTIKAEDNFAYGDIDTDPATVTIDRTTRNNVYLSDPKVNTLHKSLITVMQDGLVPYYSVLPSGGDPGTINPNGSRIGFTTPRNFVPVIYCDYSGTSQEYLKSFLSGGVMTGTVFEDSDTYYTFWSNSPYDPNHIYLWGTGWVQKIKSWPSGGAVIPDSEFNAVGFTVDGTTIHVSTPQALGWAISYINGLNGSSSHLNYNIELEADLDMGRYFWTPIGAKAADMTTDLKYTGTFNGNGHTISNLYCYYITSLSSNGLGMFGFLGDGAKVKNLFIKGIRADISNDNPRVTQYAGTVAEKAEGDVEISGVYTDGYISTANANTIMGGLVGQLDEVSGKMPFIHSCYVADSLKGFQTGGLVGQMNAGTIVNSHANPKFYAQSYLNFYLADASADGWDGDAKLSVTITPASGASAYVQDMRMSSVDGAATTVSVEVKTGDKADLSWTEGDGTKDKECCVLVKTDNGMIEYSSSNPAGTSTTLSNPGYYPYYFTLNDAERDGWPEGAKLTVKNTTTNATQDLRMERADGPTKTVVINTAYNEQLTLTWSATSVADTTGCSVVVKASDGTPLGTYNYNTSPRLGALNNTNLTKTTLSALDFTLMDMGKNGWEGAKLNVTVGGATQALDMTVMDSLSKVVTVAVPNGQTATLSWTDGDSGGVHDPECFFVVRNTKGEILYSSSSLLAGTLGSTIEVPSPTFFIGGLVGINKGTVENCYAREQEGSIHDDWKFGWLAGDNREGTLQYSYAPYEATATEQTFTCHHEGSTYYTGTPDTQMIGLGYYTAANLPSGKYSFGHCDQQITPVDANSYVDNGGLTYNKTTHTSSVHGLVSTLNAWVSGQSTPNDYATWTRTMGLDINGDYPVMVPSFTYNVVTSKGVDKKAYVCVGSMDGAALDYATDVNDFITSYGVAEGGDIYIYSDNPTPIGNNVASNGVRIAIPEDMMVIPSGTVSNARVGITFDNSDAGWLGGEPYDWHMFSSALNSVPLGVKYNTEGSTYTPAYGVDPPMTSWYQSDDPTVNATYDPAKVGYFPTDAPYGKPHTNDEVGSFDLYCYYEPLAHWINFKRNSDDHWHSMDHYKIHYTNEEGESGNEDHFINGKGYLAAVSKTSVLMADGTLNNGDISIKTSYTNPGAYYGNDLNGINLIGNPYLSYLDFDKFVQNGEEWTSCPNVDKVASNAYYILDADQQGYIGYTFGATPTGVQAPRFIHPHQGILIKVDSPQTLTFKEGMRSLTGNETSYFRGEQNVYPLVSMTCTDSEGKNDFATIELNRPEAGGGEKIKGLHAGNASIWFHCDQSDWFVAFTTPGIQEAPLRFQAYEDGVFTLTWSPENAEFSYLHLIDNITGSDVDCLATDKYVFEGRVTDYTSRFRLVFEYNDENDDEEEEESETFAFMMGDELVVNGEGVLQVFDIMGRQLVGIKMQDVQNTVMLPDMADGVYILRLTTGSVMKTQKLVINK